MRPRCSGPAAILQMAEDLQRRAQGIGRGLAAKLLVQHQQEASDRIGR